MEHFTAFANYVVDDCTKFCEGAHNSFIKLSVRSYEQITTEWSAENLVHNRTKIIKEIEKNLIIKKVEFRMSCITRVDEKSVSILGMEYVRYEKVYVLVEEASINNVNIYALNPIAALLTSVHSSTSLYYQAITKTYPTTPQ